MLRERHEAWRVPEYRGRVARHLNAVAPQCLLEDRRGIECRVLKGDKAIERGRTHGKAARESNDVPPQGAVKGEIRQGPRGTSRRLRIDFVVGAFGMALDANPVAGRRSRHDPQMSASIGV